MLYCGEGGGERASCGAVDTQKVWRERCVCVCVEGKERVCGDKGWEGSPPTFSKMCLVHVSLTSEMVASAVKRTLVVVALLGVPET